MNANTIDFHSKGSDWWLGLKKKFSCCFQQHIKYEQVKTKDEKYYEINIKRHWAWLY